MKPLTQAERWRILALACAITDIAWDVYRTYPRVDDDGLRMMLPVLEDYAKWKYIRVCT